jgi:hypothetical protein
MNSTSFARVTLSIMAILFGLTTFAHAGPPLICHVIEIGQVKSLPLVDPWKGNADYEVKNLTRDTLAILDSGAPVLVRMETLRRATIYARRDPQAAQELFTRLQARAANADAAGHPEGQPDSRSDALAWFDEGYLIETYKQWMGKDEPNPAGGLDGYALVEKAIGLRGQDPEMEFAAALITLEGAESDRRSDHFSNRQSEHRSEHFNDHQDHARKAIAGAKNDPLLAQNLALSFNRQTIAELLTKPPAGRI